jgi:hypothetical protein
VSFHHPPLPLGNLHARSLRPRMVSKYEGDPELILDLKNNWSNNNFYTDIPKEVLVVIGGEYMVDSCWDL